MRSKRSFGAAVADAAGSSSAARRTAVTRIMPGTMACRVPDSLGGGPGKQPQPLWASSLKDQPRHDDVTVHVVREEPEAAPRLRRPAAKPRPKRADPRATHAPFALRGTALGVLAAI